MNLIIIYLLAYLIGSIPFGLLLTKAAGLGDIRAIGSGNIGATNVLRTGHKPLALLTLLLDVFKGALALHIAKTLGATGDAVYLAGLAAVIGHMFPIWLKFKGGKGVATIFGVLIMFSPSLAACIATIWLGVFFITRYSSLSALIAIPLTPAFALLLHTTQTPEQSAILALLATLMIMRHKQNILNLMEGKESKFGKSHE